MLREGSAMEVLASRLSPAEGLHSPPLTSPAAASVSSKKATLEKILARSAPSSKTQINPGLLLTKR